MDIYILRDGQQSGPFESEAIPQHLAEGQILSTDLAWYEGMETWVPVAELFPVAPVEPVAPVAPAPIAAPIPAPTPANGSYSITLKVPKTKLIWFGYGGGALVALFLLFYFLSPWWALHVLKGAIASGDADAMESHIDFPALRTSAKEEFKAQMMRHLSSDGGAFSGLAEMMAPTMIDNQIDSYLTPSGLDNLIAPMKRGVDAAKASREANGSPPIDTDPFQIKNAGFNSLTDFSFTIFESKLHMRFYGLGWKIYRLEMVDLIAKGEAVSAHYATTNPASSAYTPPAPPAPPPAPKNPALDAKDGFRTFKLGSDYSTFNADDLEASSQQDADEKYFWVKNFDPQLGSAQIKYIRLTFSQGLLKEIAVGVAGEQNKLGLTDSLTTAYGPPDKNNGFGSETLNWEGEHDKLALSTDWSGNATARFTNKDVDAKVKALMEEKAKQGAAAGAKSL